VKVVDELGVIVTMENVPQDVIDAVEDFRKETAVWRAGEPVISP
jgi:hypothetical protein